jgi:hypothetical protein
MAMRKAIYLSCQRKQATVKSGPNYAHEHAGTSFGPSGSREQADIRKPGLAASPVRFAVTPYKNTLLPVKIGLLTVSLLGLALAVVLWGLEYKLSLYHPHANNSARVRVAKLWVGPKKAAVAQSVYTRSTAQLAQTRYQLGLSSIVELSQAQLQQTSGAIDNTNAQYEYRLALATLDYQVGTTP